MDPSSTNSEHVMEGVPALGETRHEALGHFLRERREALAPEQVGISSHRGRRTPGLRREEVAFLADIGVKWYARLEAGDEVHPSAATLTGIAVALRLSNAELEYMLDLAGLGQRSTANGLTTDAPEALRTFIGGVRGAAVTMGDRILTPLLWNATADALYGHSRCKTPIERNALVRTLFDPDFIAFLGAEREALIAKAVGILRLNYSSASPSPLTAAVYERVHDHPLFQEAWSRRVIASELTQDAIVVRNHALVGRLEVYAVDFYMTMRQDWFLRILNPANDQTAAKFERLEQIGTAQTVVGGSALMTA